jgi:O-antigen/teichoic acid export membrane protein
MSPVVVAQALIIVLGAHLMLPLRMDQEYSRVVLLGGLLNVGLTLALVPTLEATGTAIAVAITETVIWMVLAVLLRRRGLDVFTRVRPSLPAPPDTG